MVTGGWWAVLADSLAHRLTCGFADRPSPRSCLPSASKLRAWGLGLLRYCGLDTDSVEGAPSPVVDHQPHHPAQNCWISVIETAGASVILTTSTPGQRIDERGTCGGKDSMGQNVERPKYPAVALRSVRPESRSSCVAGHCDSP